MARFNRRHFLNLGSAALAGTVALQGGLISSPAIAADTSGYKALICVFLKGGLDQADTILPYDPTSYDQLANIRPGLFGAYNASNSSSSRNRDNLLELNLRNQADFGNRRFAVPPEMSGVQTLFNQGDLAVVGNVGPLIEPTDRAGFENETVSLPKRLFSHNDQQSTWMSLGVEGAQFGWGGRFADAVTQGASANASLYSAIATGGNDVFLSGQDINPFTASANGATRDLNILERRYLIGGEPKYNRLREEILNFYEQSDFGNSNLLKRDLARMTADGVVNVRQFNAALQTVSAPEDAFPNSNLGRQFSTVANTIRARSALGVNRQIFYTALGGFDTHSGQTSDLPRKLEEISQALEALKTDLINQGLWNDVILFTASDFGRTLIDNGDGTDHGWGAHHLVMGGSVNGGRIFGSMPPPILSDPRYTELGGRLIPTVSIEHYAASLGRWFGLTSNELRTALPNIDRFAAGELSLT